MRTVAAAISTAAVSLAALALAACQPAGPTVNQPNAWQAAEAAPIDYHAYADAHNARVARLATLASRGVVNFYYTDDDGDRTYEQGDLNFRYHAPDNLAFVVKKVGETYVWLGADQTRYWLIDLLSDETVAYVGRHDQLTIDKADRLALPVAPRDLLTLLALRPLPAEAGDTRRAASSDDALIRVPAQRLAQHLDPNLPPRYWVYRFDPDTKRPSAIALIEGDGPAQRTLLIADITDYKQVRQSAVAPLPARDDPYMASDVNIATPGEQDAIVIRLDGLVSRDSRPSVFDFESRRGALQPSKTIDLDRDQLPPAPASSSRPPQPSATQPAASSTPPASRPAEPTPEPRRTNPW